MPSSDFDENSPNSELDLECMNNLSIAPRTSESVLLTNEGSSDQVDHGASKLHQSSDKNLDPISVVDSGEMASTPNMKSSVNSVEVEERAGNPTQEERQPISIPLKTEQLTISQPEVGQSGNPCKSEEKTTPLMGEDLLDCQAKDKAEIANTPNMKPSVKFFEVKKRVGNPPRGEGQPITIPLKTEKLCAVSQPEIGQPGNPCKSEKKTAPLMGEDLLPVDSLANNNSNEQRLKIVSTGKKRKNDNSKRCGIEYKDTENGKKKSRDAADKSCRIRHKGTRQSKKTLKDDDDDKVCVNKDEESGRSKKRSKGYEYIERNILSDWFRAFYACFMLALQNCKAIISCSAIGYLMFLSFCTRAGGSQVGYGDYSSTDYSARATHEMTTHQVASSEPEIDPLLVDPGDLVKLLSSGCSADWYYSHPNGREDKICHGTECGDHRYEIEKHENNSCTLKFNATEGTSGTYRNAYFHENRSMSKSTEVKLRGLQVFKGPANQVVKKGEQVVLHCSTGLKQPVKWFKDHKLIYSEDHFKTDVKDLFTMIDQPEGHYDLRINDADEQLAGFYTCQQSDNGKKFTARVIVLDVNCSTVEATATTEVCISVITGNNRTCVFWEVICGDNITDATGTVTLISSNTLGAFQRQNMTNALILSGNSVCSVTLQFNDTERSAINLGPAEQMADNIPTYTVDVPCDASARKDGSKSIDAKMVVLYVLLAIIVIVIIVVAVYKCKQRKGSMDHGNESGRPECVLLNAIAVQQLDSRQ